jgi:hypothetical protein
MMKLQSLENKTNETKLNPKRIVNFVVLILISKNMHVQNVDGKLTLFTFGLIDQMQKCK